MGVFISFFSLWVLKFDIPIKCKRWSTTINQRTKTTGSSIQIVNDSVMLSIILF